MIIKVCGMRESENIKDVLKLDIDMMGFIFYPQSPRFVKMISSRAGIIPDYSKERLDKATDNVKLNANASKTIKRVGVFVDDMPQNIVTRVYNYNLDYVQLHGNESRTCCENIKTTIDPDIHHGLKIIKTINVETENDIKKCDDYIGVVDMFLFDTKCSTLGGSGKKFDWSFLDAYHGDIPFLLSGGIGPEDIKQIKSFHHPMFAGIDINSKFEVAPALKDVDKLNKFIKDIRK